MVAEEATGEGMAGPLKVTLAESPAPWLQARLPSLSWAGTSAVGVIPHRASRAEGSRRLGVDRT